ncbi:hypothetical protein Btus_2940 [Kyrpidia tusciae DSM 2912]|uniref:Uncharacterized protein n=1 Tax=Kyrpidia tusciae (strain DSM 2912 / NBRC 15312 / T2) TaxID=562970 RepID=D5WVN0_KYRT2|nr:hypothetical protein Btus_2940 [Kyrpidia tusciae DSM 2912]
MLWTGKTVASPNKTTTGMPLANTTPFSDLSRHVVCWRKEIFGDENPDGQNRLGKVIDLATAGFGLVAALARPE